MIKRLVFLYLAIASLLPITSAALIEVTDCNGLQNIRNNLIDDYYLSSDIDCSGLITFTPIGNQTHPFIGSLDGRGHKITNLIIDKSSSITSTAFPPSDSGESVGLFSHTSSSARIRKLTLENVGITGRQEVGSLVGFNKGEIKDCQVTGTINVMTPGPYQSSGGLVGVNEGTILNSHVQGEIIIQGGYYAGGLVGFNKGEIKLSSYKGNVNLGDEEDFKGFYGALVGGSYSGEILESSSSGTITGTGKYIGGLVGICFRDCKIRKSFSSTNITQTNSMNFTGGLVGKNEGQIKDSYSRGSVKTNSYAGGLIGLFSSGIISSTYSTGNITSLALPKGGLVGSSSGSSLITSYWDIQTSGQINSAAGIGLTTSQLKDSSNYYGWDFDNIWRIEAGSNDEYPILNWQSLSCVPDGCNGNCPSDCSAGEDPDCSGATCYGDGICNGEENYLNHPEDCQESASICGNGVIEGFEECDMGLDNTDNPTCQGLEYGDECNYCSSTCLNKTVTLGICGNGVIEGFEECDMGLLNTENACEPTEESSCTVCKTDCTNATFTYMTNYWTNLNGELINEAGMKDTVALIAWDTYLSAGTQARFEIYEFDEGMLNPHEDIRVGDKAIIIDVKEDTNPLGESATPLVAIWKITEEDLEAAGGEFDEFVFRVLDNNGNLILDYSEPLKLIDKDYESNFDITMESPLCGDVYFEDYDLRLYIPPTDPDDVVSGTVLIEETEYSFGNQGLNEIYSLNNPGTIAIDIYAENDRGESMAQKRSIIVIDPNSKRDYVSACIAEPKDISNLNSGSIKFSAEGTTAIRYDPTSPFKYEKLPLKLYWKFSDGRTNPYNQGPMAYNFYKNFASPGNNWAKLDVEVLT